MKRHMESAICCLVSLFLIQRIYIGNHKHAGDKAAVGNTRGHRIEMLTYVPGNESACDDAVKALLLKAHF